MSRQLLKEQSPNTPIRRSLANASIDDVLDILEELWGNEKDPRVPSSEEPLDGLMLTILSQNTNDRNRDRAYESLRSVVASWEDMSGMSPDRVAELIKVAGIANVKSARMLNVLSIIKDKLGDYSLKTLMLSDPQYIKSFLESLPGVGPKTAACVLAFDMNIPAFPVDTHVARFCRRMGWVEEKLSPDKIQEIMEQVVSPHRKKGAHLNIISHGKNICKARKPLCDDCPLSGVCQYKLDTKKEAIS